MFAWVNVLFLPQTPHGTWANLSLGNPTNVDGAELRLVMLFA